MAVPALFMRWWSRNWWLGTTRRKTGKHQWKRRWPGSILEALWKERLTSSCRMRMGKLVPSKMPSHFSTLLATAALLDKSLWLLILVFSECVSWCWSPDFKTKNWFGYHHFQKKQQKTSEFLCLPRLLLCFLFWMHRTAQEPSNRAERLAKKPGCKDDPELKAIANQHRRKRTKQMKKNNQPKIALAPHCFIPL